MKNKKMGMACIFVAVIMMTSGCKAAAVDTENSVPIETSSLAPVMETTKEPTETAVAATAKATQKDTATPAPTVKETTAATTTKPSETKAPASTTKTTAAPAAITKAPTATTAAPVATTAAPATTTAEPPVETTAAPASDYVAVCAEIKSELIKLLEASGQWNGAYSGSTSGYGTSSGQAWWGTGFYDDGEMSANDFAQKFYMGKFQGTAWIAFSVSCYVSDGNIYLEYVGYDPAVIII